jgi:hypothetical protein
MAGQAEFQARIERIRATRGEYKPAYDPADYQAKPVHKAVDAGEKPGGLSRLNKMMAVLLLLGVAAWGSTMMLPQVEPHIAALLGGGDGAAEADAGAAVAGAAGAAEAPARPPVRRGDELDSGFKVLTSRTGLADKFRAESGM